MPRVDRFDFGARLRADKMTEQGFARVPSRVARIGIQKYQGSDGKTLLEYRPPGEIFSASSLKTYETAVVTDGHAAFIDPDNWRTHAIGFVINPHQDEGRYVAADLVIQDAAALAKIESGDLQEISAGYTCDLHLTPGEVDGERYDAVQTAVKINHVALGPKSWGRAGPAVRLQLDGERQAASAFAVVQFTDGDEPCVFVSAQALLGAIRGGYRRPT